MNKSFLFLSFLLLIHVSPVFAKQLPAGIIELEPYPAPSLKLEDIDGIAYQTPLANNKWMFVHFWASWCGPCRREMPAIQAMWKKMQGENLEIALINTAENEDTVFSFLAIHAPEIRPLMDRDGQVTEQWQPRGLPATYLVDPHGKVRYQALGGRDWDSATYMEFLSNLISQ
jgi:thiol-disulfide isomerase/thioredoxin